MPRWFAWEFWSDVSNWGRIEGAGVEWIRLEGPLARGAVGATKMRGQDPQTWVISQLEAGRSTTIEMALEGAVFSVETRFEALDAGHTLISQRMTLDGDCANEYAPATRVFETSAPQGLTKLVAELESTRSLGRLTAV